MSSTSKVVMGTLAGVAAGVVLGLLFAPDSGTETRRKIKEGYTDLSESLKSKISDLVTSVKEEYETAKGKATDLANKATGRTPSMKGEPKDSYTS
jgi:gas vesicle protein